VDRADGDSVPRGEAVAVQGACDSEFGGGCISFACRGSAQRKYSAFDRKLLAGYLAVRHFCFMPEGKQFTIFSDHKLLSFALHRVSEPWSARQQRQLAYISEFTSDVQHVPGVANVVADALSWPPPDPDTGAGLSGVETCPGQPSFNRPGPQSSVESSAVEQPVIAAAVDSIVDFAAMMEAAQEWCEDCKWICQQTSLKVRPCVVSSAAVLCDWSTGWPQPFVPAAYRADVFNNKHGLAHLGIRGTRRLISSHFV
jgi:RNase H-like domain found in reverse transcriptase